MLSSQGFLVLALTWRVRCSLSSLRYVAGEGGPTSSFCIWIIPSVKETVLSAWGGAGILLKNYLTVSARDFFWTPDILH